MKQFIDLGTDNESNQMFVVNSLMGYIPVGQLPITSELLKKKNFVGHVLDPYDLEV